MQCDRSSIPQITRPVAHGFPVSHIAPAMHVLIGRGGQFSIRSTTMQCERLATSQRMRPEVHGFPVSHRAPSTQVFRAGREPLQPASHSRQTNTRTPLRIMSVLPQLGTPTHLTAEPQRSYARPSAPRAQGCALAATPHGDAD
jgi:hypothetical protein